MMGGGGAKSYKGAWMYDGCGGWVVYLAHRFQVVDRIGMCWLPLFLGCLCEVKSGFILLVMVSMAHLQDSNKFQ
jgi:hypothetical protein